MLKFSKEIIVLTLYDTNPNETRSHRRLREIFNGAVGALDSTFVDAVISTNVQVPYRLDGKGERMT